MPKPALSKAGDAVTLRAEMDLVMVVTACSMDIVPINGECCTGIRIEVLSEQSTVRVTRSTRPTIAPDLVFVTGALLLLASVGRAIWLSREPNAG